MTVSESSKRDILRYVNISPDKIDVIYNSYDERFAAPPDDAAMQNRDAQGHAHYPGWSKEALRFLYEDRNITASGHETTDTDPGFQTDKDDYSLESYVLGLNHYQIEMLADLDKVPESGALVFVSWPKPEGGTGFPARVIAILP